MNGPGMNRDGPPFHHMLRASGQSEVWHDMFQDAKLRQFGWRCTTSESAYHTGTLIGNWCEKRFDTGYTSKRRQPLSQVSSDALCYLCRLFVGQTTDRQLGLIHLSECGLLEWTDIYFPCLSICLQYLQCAIFADSWNLYISPFKRFLTTMKQHIAPASTKTKRPFGWVSKLDPLALRVSHCQKPSPVLHSLVGNVMGLVCVCSVCFTKVQQREPRSFPGHQPELNPPHMNAIPKSCYGQDFTAERRECNTCAGESCDEPSSSRQENITATHDDQ